MRLLFLLLALVLPAAGRPNVLLLCIDDLRPELRCYGAEHVQSPNIDRLAGSGLLFECHYVQAPTCGASRYALLTGTYDRRRSGNDALFRRARQLADPPARPSLPRHFRNHGYTTVSVGKVSHHPGGRGGSDWDDPAQPELPGAWHRHLQPTGAWQHPRGIMHGLAHGEIRTDPGKMDVYQAKEGGDEIYPDGLITATALDQLETLHASDQPFLLAIGWIRPHLPFGAPKKYLDLYADTDFPPIPHPDKPAGKTTWHGSGEFMRYHRWDRDPREDADFATALRRHYAACVSYADAQVGLVLDRLEKLGLADDTIVLLWGDHGWHLGEHAVWGKHTLFEESLRSPLLLRAPGLSDGERRPEVVETLDIYPTLCALADLPAPDFLDGQNLAEKSADPGTAVAYHGKATTLRTADFRLIRHAGGAVELYDHRTPETETRNVAKEHPGVVERLTRLLDERLAP